MRKHIIIGITAALIGATTLTASLASAGGKWDRCDDEGRHNKYTQMSGEQDHKQLRRMVRKLDLSETQQAQLKQLFRDQREVMDSLHDQRKAMRSAMQNLDVSATDYDQQLSGLIGQAEQMAAAMVTQRAAQKKAMFELLTPEQQTQFLTLKR